MNKRIIAFLSCSLLVVSLCAQTSLNNLYSEFSNEKKAEKREHRRTAPEDGKPLFW